LAAVAAGVEAKRLGARGVRLGRVGARGVAIVVVVALYV